MLVFVTMREMVEINVAHSVSHSTTFFFCFYFWNFSYHFIFFEESQLKSGFPHLNLLPCIHIIIQFTILVAFISALQQKNLKWAKKEQTWDYLNWDAYFVYELWILYYMMICTTIHFILFYVNFLFFFILILLL